jgi:hypothetical protein
MIRWASFMPPVEMADFEVMENRSLNSLALAQRDDNTSADCLTASLE